MPRTKPKAAHLMIAVIALLLLGYGTVYLIGKYYLNASEIKKILTEKVESKLNRKLTLDDDLEFSISWDMSPRIQIKNLTLSNYTYSTQPTMLSVESLVLKFNLLYLIFKEIHITKLELVKPVLRLETNSNKNNWDFENASDKTTSDGGSSLHVGEVSVTDGTVYYTKDNAKPIKTTLATFNFSSNSSGTDFSVDLDGSYGDTPITVDADADLGGHQIKIKLSKLQFGKSDLSGKLLIKDNYKDISGEFNSSLLRVADFPSTASNSNSSGEYSVPNVQIPTNNLKDIEIDLPIKIKTLNLGKISLSDVNLYITAKDSTLSMGFKPDMEIASGQLSVDLNYNVKGNNPNLSANIKGSGLKLESILNMFMDKSPIVGSNLTLKADLHSTGSKLNDLVNNLNGHILATASPGKYINSPSILTAMITFNKSQSSTDLECAVMNFHVNNGVATATNGIGIEAASVNVLGDGKVDLRNGRINFSIKPHNVGNNPLDLKQYSIAQFVNVTGTITNPSVSLNPMGLLAPGGVVAKQLLGTFTGGLGALPIPGMSNNSKNTTTSTENNISPCKTASGSGS